MSACEHCGHEPDEDDGFDLIGDYVAADCVLRPETDGCSVAVLGKDGAPFGVYVALLQYDPRLVDEAQQEQRVVLSPADARRIAAALLDCADAVDGTDHLNFNFPEEIA